MRFSSQSLPAALHVGADLGCASQRLTRINDEAVAQAAIHGGKVGLLASFNVVRFDDVVIATPRSN